MNTFFDRLRWLAHGRTVTPWLKSLGWSGGTVGRVLSGKSVPTADALEPLALQESVSLSWLLAGVGSPYVVQFIPDSEAWLDALAAARRVEQQFLQVQNTVCGPLALIWRTSAPYGLQVLVGDIPMPPPRSDGYLKVDVPDFSPMLSVLLARGYASAMQVFEHWQEQGFDPTDLAFQMVAEPLAEYRQNPARELQLMEWMSLGHTLPEDDLAALIGLGRRLSGR